MSRRFAWADSTFHYRPRRTFWQKVGDIQWFFVIISTVLIASGLFLAAVVFIAPQQAEEAKRVAIECAAQEGREPFRLSKFEVICIDD